MGNLIKNELAKVFRKKGTYIVLIILAVFVILTNLIYKFMLSALMPGDYKSSEEYISYAREQVKTMTPESNRDEYIQMKTEIDVYDLKKQFPEGEWQAYIIDRDFFGYYQDINVYKYGTDGEKTAFTEDPTNVLNKQLEKLKSSDWKAYAQEEVDKTEKEIAELKMQKQLLGSVANTQETEMLLKTLETKLEMAKTRLEKDIPYGDNYLNDAIETIIACAGMDFDYNNQSLSFAEKREKQSSRELYEKAKYALENKKDVNNYSTARGVLLNSFSEYEIFLVIFVVMITGGMISSEIEKGTIKMLLVKPYKRWQILLAKYIVSMMMIGFIMLAMFVMQIVVGGVLFGFDSLSIPVVTYNFSTNSTEVYNLFAYWGMLALAKLPMYLLIGTLAFAISCIFGNTVLAIVLPIIGDIAGAIINNLASTKSIKQVAAFPTLNWDFTQFLFGKLPEYEFTNIGFASCVCLVYFVIMLVVSFIAFNKKEIKNV